MFQLTRLSGFDWVLLLVLAFAVALLVTAWRQRPGGTRVGGALLIPVLGTAAVLAFLFAVYSHETAEILTNLTRRPVAAALAVGVLVVALAIVDVAFARVVSPLATRVERRLPARRAADATLAVVVAGAVVLALVGTTRLQAAIGHVRAPEPVAAQFEVMAIHRLPSAPMSIAFTGEREGYVSLGAGQIAWFRLPEAADGSLELRTVATGFSFPRGIAVANGTLFVADLGPMPCDPPYPRCMGHDVAAVQTDGERQTLEESRGQLIAFDIATDGELVDRRVVLDHLPVVSTIHGLNDAVTGPDGHVYLTVGHLDFTWETPDLPDTLGLESPDLLGTLLRVSPDGGDVEVVARGLRNVYGLTFDDRGDLWLVDNDGPTVSGWRHEEVVRVTEGAHYGFPYDATFGPHRLRTDQPVWITTATGSAGIEWTGDLGLGPGLLLGSCDRIDHLRLTEHDGTYRVDQRTDFARALEIAGCVTFVETTGAREFVVGLFRDDALYVVHVGE